MVNYISDFVKEKFDSGYSGQDIADMLKVSPSMVSAYRRGYYNASLDVAVNAYNRFNVVFHPFSEESLKIEVKNRGLK